MGVIVYLWCEEGISGPFFFNIWDETIKLSPVNEDRKGWTFHVSSKIDDFTYMLYNEEFLILVPASTKDSYNDIKRKGLEKYIEINKPSEESENFQRVLTAVKKLDDNIPLTVQEVELLNSYGFALVNER